MFLCLCEGGCFDKIFGMGPGLVSMSPLSSISKCGENVWIMRRFLWFLSFVYRCLYLCIVLWSRFVKCFGFLVVFGVCLVYAVLYGFFLHILIVWFWA